MPANLSDIAKHLWAAADELRANSKLESSEYSVPVLGLIFLRYADYQFTLPAREFADRSAGVGEVPARGDMTTNLRIERIHLAAASAARAIR